MEDLKLIKKLYGEAMAHFCRDCFSSILEEKNLLPVLLQENFAPSHMLYEDLEVQNKLDSFKNYIYGLITPKTEEKVEYLSLPTPEELMSLAGYTLFECKSEADIQRFKKYYAWGEELCTFRGGRLEKCHVFFAVKKNVKDIKRIKFRHPERQDKYGTSVISIQFSKDESHTLSIKNRYNHHVVNPDATFSNNLDNIIEGLTESFAQTYGLNQVHKNECFEIPGYIRANDGKWYKFNFEDNNIYYCPDNIIIDNGKVIKYPKEKYMVIDFFILDLEGQYNNAGNKIKLMRLYDDTIEESFHDVIGVIKSVTVVKKGEAKEITIINENDEKIKITINKNNQIIGLKSNDIKQVEDDFLSHNSTLEEIDLPELRQAGDYFLWDCVSLKRLELPNLQKVGERFLYTNRALTTLILPNVQRIGKYFLVFNNSITSLDMPNVQQVGMGFLYFNHSLVNINLPNLRCVGSGFLKFNQNIKMNFLKIMQMRLYFEYLSLLRKYMNIAIEENAQTRKLKI